MGLFIIYRYDDNYHMDNNRLIKEEDIEESLESLGQRNRGFDSKQRSKKSSMPLSDSSNLISKLQSTVNDDNKMMGLFSNSNSPATSQNIDPSDQYANSSSNVIIDPVRGKELLTITVEIGNGQKENIVIFENDDAQHVSDAFCNRHNINNELKVIFTNQIAENIDQVREEIALEQGEDKYSTESKLINYKNESPPSIEKPILNEISNMDYNNGLNTQKQMVKQNINFMKNLDSRSLNQSMGNANVAYNNVAQTPYGEFGNYNQSLRSSSKHKSGSNLWYSVGQDNKPWINDKSKQIANSKKTSNISVHNRLHQHALSKQRIEHRNNHNSSLTIEQRFDISELNHISSMKSTSKKRRKNKSLNGVSKTFSTDYGSRLYNNGVKKIEEVERKHKEAQLLNEINETKDLTFQPTINPISYHYGSSENELPEDNLIKKGIMSKDKIEQMRAEVTYSNHQSCSFKPKINENSRKIANQREQFFDDEIVPDENNEHSRGRMQPNQYLQLYDDAMKRVDRHNNIYSM